MNYLKKIIFISQIIIYSSYSFADNIYSKTWYQATSKNDSAAQYEIALAYNPLEENNEFGCGSNKFVLETNSKKRAICENKSEKKYIEFLTKSAKNAYPLAQTDLGLAYVEGKLVTKNVKEGLYWLEKAATPIPANAKFRVGEGTLWLNKEGKQYGVGKAHYYLGLLYEKGIDVKVDYTKAINHYEIASKSYDWGFYNIAQYQLYKLYKEKLKDPKKSLYWLEKMANRIGKFADPKTLSAQLTLAEYFLSGGQLDGSKSDKPNYEEAAKWLIKLNETSDIPSDIFKLGKLELAWLYLNGFGVKKDIQKATLFYKEAFSFKNAEKALNNQSLNYQFLYYVISLLYDTDSEPDLIKASEIMQTIFAGNVQDEKIFYKTLFNLYRNIPNWEVRNGNFQIQSLLKLAQYRGFVYGYYWDAQIKQNKTVEKLIDLNKKALSIEPNNPIMLYQLGTIYDFFIEDPKKAISYYQQAASMGYSKANYRLGVIYYLGKGVKQDYIQAWNYLNLAAEQGFFAASRFLISIDKTHPDFEKLTTLYVNHPQNYLTPTIIVNNEDWLNILNENNPTPKVIYHYTKHTNEGNGLKYYESCKAALTLAEEGDETAQDELIRQITRYKYFYCIPKKELIVKWIDNSNNSADEKEILKANFYKMTKQNN